MNRNDTIAAIATPIGHGGIGIVRMSGSKSLDIIKNVFRPKKKIDISKTKTHTIHYGYIHNSGGIPIDEVLVSVMRTPMTYTKEDTVEINCHGSNLVLQKILEVLICNGARLAEPGEFTKRAFLNGRMDLTQAESVIDLINSKTEAENKSAMKHLEGELSRYIKNLQDIVREVLVLLEVQIDFTEETNIALNYGDLLQRLIEASSSLKNLLETYKQGKILKSGISIAIVGRTNVGKSSLFNVLVDLPSRALVANVHGTTRDYIDEYMSLGGRKYRIIDTAGFIVPRNVLERRSLKITRRCIDESDLVLFIVDGSKSFSKSDLSIFNETSSKPGIVIINKTDLKMNLSIKRFQDALEGKVLINISCKKNTGIQELKNEIIKITKDIYGNLKSTDLVITNVRHKNILDKALILINEVILAIERKLPIELIASELRHTLETLQEMTGERISENILDDIFSKFCIGK
jgi:tRNA modification GTPase